LREKTKESGRFYISVFVQNLVAKASGLMEILAKNLDIFFHCTVLHMSHIVVAGK